MLLRGGFETLIYDGLSFLVIRVLGFGNLWRGL